MTTNKEEELKREIMKEVFGDEKSKKKFQEAIKELRYEIDRESECQDMIDFIEDLVAKVKSNFEIAIDKSYLAGQISIHNMSRKACYEAGKQSAEENSQTYVKGYKDGKQEAEKEIKELKELNAKLNKTLKLYSNGN